MAVKIRLRRMGAKKAPFYQDIHVTVVSSKKSAHITQWLTLLKSRLMQKRLRSGLLTAHSQLTQLRAFLKKKASFNL